MCARTPEVCPVRAKSRSLRGYLGGKCSLWGLIRARLRSRELVFCLLGVSTALTGTVWCKPGARSLKCPRWCLQLPFAPHVPARQPTTGA
jgi:hypothetical protein